MPFRLCLLAALVAAGLPARAQDVPLAVTWSTSERALQGVADRRESETSDPGALRGRMSQNACRSTVADGGDLPVVVRFDSTEATLMGRGAAVVNAVGTFYGSAWDVSDPAAPRRLNMLFRELTTDQDTMWTPGAPGEPLLVMASSYDGTGTTYAGRNLALNQVDCLYALFLEPTSGGGAAAPFEMDIRPAGVWPLRAARRDDAAGTSTDVRWTYGDSDGSAIRIRRIADPRDVGPVVATLPASARQFTDTGYAIDSLYRYRVEAVNAAGQLVSTSTLTFLARIGESSGMNLLGALDVGRVASDVWGYVGPDGREYALLNARGLTVIDVTDPTQPTEVAHVPGGTSDIEAAGHYVYVTGDNAVPGGATTQVQVIDIADPTAPVLVREFWGHADDPGVGVHTLSISGDRLYLNGNIEGFSVWSLADPAAPAYLSSYREGRVHDLLARGDTVYAAVIQGEGVHVIDMSDPAQPTRIASFTYPVPGAHNICSTPDGRYLFVGDEVGAGPWTRVFDVSDLDNVELVAEMIVDPDVSTHNCHYLDGRLYVGHYTKGVRVWDVSTPTAPQEVAFFNVGLGAETNKIFSGTWSVWPHLPSGHILASSYNVEAGAPSLLVLELDGSIAAEPPPSAAPAALELAPNPTAGDAAALVTLTAPATVALAVYDVLGRRVASVADAEFAAGVHRLSVPTAALPAGVYVVRLSVDGRPAGAQTLTVAR